MFKCSSAVCTGKILIVSVAWLIAAEKNWYLTLAKWFFVRENFGTDSFFAKDLTRLTKTVSAVAKTPPNTD